MIKSYRNKTTEQASNGKFGKTISPDIRKRVVMRLERLAAATTLDDLRVPPSHMLEALKGDRRGQYSIRINRKFRVCFEWKNGDAYNVEIVDYH